jgi:hypothetical protein
LVGDDPNLTAAGLGKSAKGHPGAPQEQAQTAPAVKRHGKRDAKGQAHEGISVTACDLEMACEQIIMHTVLFS